MPARSKKIWIIVCDSAKARIFLNQGPGKGLELLSEFNSEQARAAGKDILTDAPGRSFDSAGPGRHAMEQEKGPKETAQEGFIRDLADILNAAAGDKFDELVLAAAPKTLGYLREQLNKTTERRLRAEIDKDLTNVPEHNLPGHLNNYIYIE